MPDLGSTYAKLDAYNVFTKYQTIADPVTPELHFGSAGWSGGLGWWGTGIDQAASVPLRDFVVAYKGYAFSVDDATTASNTTLTSVDANFRPYCVGFSVTGAGIPAGTTIAAYVSPSQVTLSQATTATASNVRVTFSHSSFQVNDLEYWSHNGFGAASVGFGVSQPADDYRMYIQPDANDLTQGNLRLQPNPSQTGDLLSATTLNVANGIRLRTDGALLLSSSAADALVVQNNGTTPLFTVDGSGGGAVKATVNAMGVGPGATGAAVATLDIVQTGSNDAGMTLRTSTWGSFRITASGTNPGTTTMATQNLTALAFGTNGVTRATVPIVGGFVIGSSALATSATDGFIYVPSVNGTPTGTPSAQSSTVPLVVDTAASKLWAYIGGTWKSVTFA